MKLSLKRGSVYASVLLAISAVLGLISANLDSLSKNQLGQVVSTVPYEFILDSESSSGVSIVGSWTKSSSASPYSGSSYLHDGETGKGQKSVTFSPNLTSAGDYDIYLMYSASGNRATNTPVTIQTSNGEETVFVNQQKKGGFTLIGSFPLSSGSAGKVTVSTENTKGYVIVDAVKWVGTSVSVVSTPTTPTDTTAPAVPTGLSSSNITANSATLSWTAVSTSDLAGYRLYRNGTKLADLGKVTTYTVTGLSAATTYSFQLSAVDTSGNESAKGGAVSVGTLNNNSSIVSSTLVFPPVASDVPAPDLSGGTVYNLYAGTPDVANYEIGSNGVCVNGSYWGNDSLSNTTRGNYYTAGAVRKGTWTYTASDGTQQSSSFNSVWSASYHHGSVIFRFEIPNELKGKKIKKAYFGFNGNNPAGGSDGGNFPTGREQIPIKTILNPKNYSEPFTCSYIVDPSAGTAEANWNGASFLYRYQVPNGTGGYTEVRWGDNSTDLVVDGKTYGKTGDLTSVAGPTVGYISFAKNAMSYSTDVKDAIQNIIDNPSTNQGFFLDVNNLLSPDAFGDYSNKYNPKFTSKVYFYSSYSNDPAVRPRLTIVVDDNSPTTPTDTTAPAVPTGLSSSNITANSATLSWTAVSTSDLAGYRLYRNGTKLADLGKVTTYTVTGLSANTTYSFQLSAVDTSGNESAKGGAVSVGTLNATTPTTPSSVTGFILEKITRVGGNHQAIFPDRTISYPAKGVPFFDPTTGYKITRISEVTDGAFPKNPAGYKGHISEGLFNGYSRYMNVNKTGRYAIAFGTTGLAVVYDLSNNKLLSVITTKDPSKASTDGKIGERAGIRWDKVGGAGRDTLIYYFAGLKFYKQDVLIGPSSEQVVYDFSQWDPNAKYIHEESYGDFSDDMRYRALRLCLVSYCLDDPSGKPNTVENVVFDMVAGKPLAGVVKDKWPKGNDISPDGQWLQLTGYNLFYRISDLANGITDQPVTLPSIGAPGTATLRGGHGGWVYDNNGEAVFAWFDNSDDWLHVYNPRTKSDFRVLHGTETGYWDYHIARAPLNTRGWIMVSAYGRYQDKGFGDGNQLYIIEMKPVVTGVHPNLTTVNSAEFPRIWRVGPTYNQRVVNGVDVGGYFAEGFANYDLDGSHIYWGGNWLGTTNLELYQLELPTNWRSALSGNSSTPTTPTDTTAPAVPTGLSSSNITANSATLSWTAVSTSDLAGYRLYRNGTKLADLGKVTTYTVTGLSANTTYSFQLSAVDTSGNESAKGGAVSVGTKTSSSPADTVPPSIFINQLLLSQIKDFSAQLTRLLNLIFPKAEAADISRYTATKSPITLKGSATDNTSVARIDWVNNRGGSGQAVGTSTWTIENLALASGDNQITISAVDLSGNKQDLSLIITYSPSGSVPATNSSGGGGGGRSSSGGSGGGTSKKTEKVTINQGTSLVVDRNVKLTFDSSFVGKSVQLASKPDFSDAKTIVAGNEGLVWDICPANNCALSIYEVYYKKSGDPVSAAESSAVIYLPPALAQLLNLSSTIKLDSVSSSNNSSSNLSPLSRSIWYGLNGEDVKTLQTVLNQNGFTVANSGVGSSGQEGTYFGQATKAAVVRFQQAYGITPALGGVGPATMAKINELLNK